jgi:cyanobactin maturation PatA/PatG family protease
MNVYVDEGESKGGARTGDAELSRPSLSAGITDSLRSLQARTLGDPAVCVAVLDGPVDVDHPCFRGASLRRVGALASGEAGQGQMSAHGTHVASVIFGQPESAVAGVAPRCRGLLVPIFRDDDQGYLSQLDLARAIEQAVEAGAHLINVSGGELAPTGEPDPTLARALQLCDAAGVLVIAATGNDGCDCLHVPASVPTTLAVGALTEDGQPLESGNWGAEYRANGLLAPGERILGAVPGGGTATATGSSFATPIVTGVAALLLDLQRRAGEELDPTAVRDALLASATPCSPRGAPECARYLAGTLNVPGAYALITRGGRITVPEHASRPIGAAAAATPQPVERVSSVGVAPSAASPPIEGDGVHSSVAPAASPPEPGAVTPPAPADSPVSDPGPDLAQAVAPGPSADVVAPRAIASSTAPSHVTASSAAQAIEVAPATAGTEAVGVRPSADCNCGGNGATGNIFAIGEIGFDFETEARRDSFRQLMNDVFHGSPPVRVKANPYDVFQLADYLDAHHSESTELTWTLMLDLTPIYAVEAEAGPYADEVYDQFRVALRNQAYPPDDPEYVSRVSIPGMLTNRTKRLYSGQVVPVVVAQPRGLYTWNEPRLVDAVVEAVLQDVPKADTDYVRKTTRNFLDKVYYQLRNLGQSSPDRAINYAATNAFIFTEGIANGILSGTLMPVSPDQRNLYTLDTITASKSAYCRVDSDCWDIQLTFYDPENVLRSRAVYQSTIDVSDLMPVQLAATHQFFVTS